MKMIVVTNKFKQISPIAGGIIKLQYCAAELQNGVADFENGVA